MLMIKHMYWYHFDVLSFNLSFSANYLTYAYQLVNSIRLTINQFNYGLQETSFAWCFNVVTNSETVLCQVWGCLIAENGCPALK